MLGGSSKIAYSTAKSPTPTKILKEGIKGWWIWWEQIGGWDHIQVDRVRSPRDGLWADLVRGADLGQGVPADLGQCPNPRWPVLPSSLIYTLVAELRQAESVESESGARV